MIKAGSTSREQNQTESTTLHRSFNLRPEQNKFRAIYNDSPPVEALTPDEYGLCHRGSVLNVEEGKTTFLVDVDPKQVTSNRLLLFSYADSDVPTAAFEMQSYKISEDRVLYYLTVDNAADGSVYAYSPTQVSQEMQERFFWISDPYARENVLPKWDLESIKDKNLGVRYEYSAPKSIVRKTPQQMGLENLKRVFVSDDSRIITEVQIQRMTIPDIDLPQETLETHGTFAFLLDPQVREATFRNWNKFGVTSIQILPVHETFDEKSLILDGQFNDWGYMNPGFFGFNPNLFKAKDYEGRLNELWSFCRALKDGGFEVIFDHVGMHTSESDFSGGSITSMAALAMSKYYLATSPDSEKPYYHFAPTGCGNVLNPNENLAVEMRMASYRYFLRFSDILRIDQMSAGGEVLKDPQTGEIITADEAVSRKYFIENYKSSMDKIFEFKRDTKYFNELVRLYSNRIMAELSTPARHATHEVDKLDGITAHSFMGHINNVLLAGLPTTSWLNFDNQYQAWDCDVDGKVSISTRVGNRRDGNRHISSKSNTRGRNKLLNILDCHDGLQNYDLAVRAVKELVDKKLISMDSLQANGVSETSIVDSIAFAQFAMVILSSGPYLFSEGSQFLRSQKGERNLYKQPIDKEKQNRYEVDLSKLTKRELEFANNIEKLTTLRKNLGVFNDPYVKQVDIEARYYDENGSLLLSGGDPNFLSTESSDRFAACFVGGENLRGLAPFVVFNGKPRTFVLPKDINQAFYLKRILDTTQVAFGQDPFEQFEYKNNTPHQYTTQLPGVIAFQLVKR